MDDLIIRKRSVVDSTKLLEQIHAEIRALLVQHQILADYIKSEADKQKYILFLREDVPSAKLTTFFNLLVIAYDKYNVKAKVIENTSHKRLFYIQINKIHTISL